VGLAQVRTEDIFARYGGEEFACILRQTRAQEGTILAERIRRAIEEHRFIFETAEAEVEIPVSVSIGVCELKPAVTDIEAFIQAADRYLYRAKEGGRNRVESSANDD